MKLVEILRPELIATDLRASSKDAVLGEIGELIARHTGFNSPETITKVLIERERLATTGIGEGVAIPHGKLAGLKQIHAAFGISQKGVAFEAVDGEPVHIFAALLAPQNSSGDHLRALARISRLLKDQDIRARILAARTPAEVFSLVCDEDGKY